jgi:hypothetical protein
MSMFANAPVAAKKPTAKKGKTKEQIEMKGLEAYAALCAAMEALKGQKEVYEAQLKAEMADKFVADGCAAGRKPESFDAFEGTATGSMQLRARMSRSYLTEEECEILDDANVPYTLDVKVEETFVINPAYATDAKLLAKVEEALKKVKGLPEDFIQRQQGESHNIVTEDSIAAVFKKPVKQAAKLLPVVTCLAIRAKITGDFMPVIDAIMADEQKVAA